MSDINELLNDSKLLHSFIKDKSSDLNILAGSNLAIVKMLQLSILRNDIQYDVMKEQLQVSLNKISELESRLNQKEEHIDTLHQRLSTLEQYSRRNTVIMSGVPHSADENLESKVCKLINDANILPQKFTVNQISHVHRNRFNQKSTASITLQFARGIDKDRLFSQKPKFKACHKASKINIFHAMSPTLVKEQKAMQSVSGVDWVDYRGHNKHFVVKLKEEHDKEFFRNIRGCNELMTAISNLPTYKPVIIQRRPTNLLYNDYNSDESPPPLELSDPESKAQPAATESFKSPVAQSSVFEDADSVKSQS